jgi:phosphate acetyltransferase
MSHTYLLVTTRHEVGLTSVSFGLVRAFDQSGQPVAFVKPIAQLRPGYLGPERSTTLIGLATRKRPPAPLTMERVSELLARGDEQILLEEVVARVKEARASFVSEGVNPVVVVEGLVPAEGLPFAQQLNVAIARALDAEVVLVGIPEDDDPIATAERFQLAAREYAGTEIAGCLLNKLREPATATTERTSGFMTQAATGMTFQTAGFEERVLDYRAALQAHGLALLGAVPFRAALGALRVRDVAALLDARIVRRGDLDRRVLSVEVAAKPVPSVLSSLCEGTLILVPSDRHDVIMAAALKTLGGEPLAGLLLTGGLEPSEDVLELCSRSVEAGLTILAVGENTLPTALRVMNLDREVPIDDRERAELAMNTVAGAIEPTWLKRSLVPGRPRRLSPPAFRHELIERARAAKKRIVLPEGEEPRTVAAAIACELRGIARCILLGDPRRIAHVAADQGLRLPDALEIRVPRSWSANYATGLYERRKHKGVTLERAAELLENEIVLATMMLAEGHVDGLVAGATHTTAETLRPALQLIKTAPGASLVSSVFFMCLPEQVLVYGDCAVNPDPDAEMLADIALQSAASAQAFGIAPRVALISYSTGTSGAGSDVEKVAQATRIARERRPDLPIDGPLQYDAAVMPDVARSKAPESPVAGRATVLVFPDLNTGNTTYKAVQRSAQVVSMGPMLQGLARPVNDLSRGCLIEDVVYTIALTAIQAVAAESPPG